ncbi:hypothetical protein J6590_091736, partial [Homalodisca vitripennis]
MSAVCENSLVGEANECFTDTATDLSSGYGVPVRLKRSKTSVMKLYNTNPLHRVNITSTQITEEETRKTS